MSSVSKHTKASTRYGDPVIVVRCEEAINRVVAQAREAAGASFDAYVIKMVTKIGGVDSASVAGYHLWNGSVLTVTKGDVVERWHTQQIVNCSSLGTLFNQWPTRLMK